MRGLEKPNAGVGTHIENGRATEVQANVERFRLGNTYGHDNLDVRTPTNERRGLFCLKAAEVLSLSRHGVLILGWRASHGG